MNDDQENITLATSHAKAIWTTMSKQERAAVRFGMIPLSAAQALEKLDLGLTARHIALGFMAAAKSDLVWEFW